LDSEIMSYPLFRRRSPKLSKNLLQNSQEGLKEAKQSWDKKKSAVMD